MKIQAGARPVSKKGIVIMDEQWFLEKYPYRNRPFTHQAAYLQRFWKEKEAALFADTGTGKSFMLINNASLLYDRGKINALLVVAPKGVYRNWFKLEIPKHMPEHVTYTMACWTPSPRKAEKAEMDAMLNATDTLRVLVMNVEAFSTEKGLAFAQMFLRVTTAFMAVDESTTIKNHSAKRTKGITKIGRLAAFRRVATGSPITKSPLDVYAQCEFLNPDLLNAHSYFAFQARYAVTVERKMATHTFKQIVGYRRLDELQQKLAEFSFRIRKDECFDLPDKVFLQREVELTDEQRKAYDQMVGMALATFEQGMTTTANALTQIMRLQQIVCGHITLDDGTQVELKNNRLNELLAAIEESSGKIIIWATFRHDIFAIKQALQKAYGMNSVATYFGDTTADERSEIVERFQNPEDELRFFIGQPRTGGYGLTLTEAHTMIYYSNSYDLEVRLQSEARIDRYGQKNKMTYIDLSTPGTVDEKIVDALLRKMDIANEVLGEKAREWIR
jgi:SNF2 family DNA or RNA helicase